MSAPIRPASAGEASSPVEPSADPDGFWRGVKLWAERGGALKAMVVLVVGILVAGFVARGYLDGYARKADVTSAIEAHGEAPHAVSAAKLEKVEASVVALEREDAVQARDLEWIKAAVGRIEARQLGVPVPIPLQMAPEAVKESP
jgi:hypothetical protein